MNNSEYEKSVDKKYKELAHQIAKLADQTNGPDKHIVQAMSYQVDAAGDLDDQLEKLNTSISKLNQTTTKLMIRQIWLILIQIAVALVIGYAALKIAK